MVSCAILSLFTLSSVCGLAAAERKLAYVTVLFRHGERSPVEAYPTDPHKESAWPQGFGQLTQEGMRQHLNLGKFLRKQYKGFLNDSYIRHEILVRSTDYDRTLMSALSNLAGLYPPSDGQVITPDLKWQPVPVHTVPLNEEKLLKFPRRDCPRYTQLMNETKHTEAFANVSATYKDIVELVKTKTGLNETDVVSVWKVYDTLSCESRHNMTIPDWATTDVMEKLRILNDFGLQVLFGLYKQQEKSRLQGGVLLGEIVKNLSKMAVPDSKQQLKLMMLSAAASRCPSHSHYMDIHSAPLELNIFQMTPNDTKVIWHDTTIAALQASLNVSNWVQPPYAACHIFELYRHDDGSASVSMLYRNDSNVEPYPLQLPGCSLDCPLEDFVRITKSSISDDWDKECQPPCSFLEVICLTMVVVGCVFVFLLLVLLCFLCCKKKQTRQRDTL